LRTIAYERLPGLFTYLFVLLRGRLHDFSFGAIYFGWFEVVTLQKLFSFRPEMKTHVKWPLSTIYFVLLLLNFLIWMNHS